MMTMEIAGSAGGDHGSSECDSSYHVCIMVCSCQEQP